MAGIVFNHNRRIISVVLRAPSLVDFALIERPARAINLVVVEFRRDMKDLGDVRSGAISLPGGLLFKLGFGVAAAENAVRYGNPDDEKVEEFPATGEDGLVRGL